ncbi:MAG: hypothetical protein H0V90_09750 [Blastocatellia bacterium]|nr:hypothetical protein [Blastocatellia bacterium]
MHFALVSILSLLVCSQTVLAQDNGSREISSLVQSSERSKVESETLAETISGDNGDAQKLAQEVDTGKKTQHTELPPENLASTLPASDIGAKKENAQETGCGFCIDYDFKSALNDQPAPFRNLPQNNENAADDPQPPDTSTDFRWGPAIRQSLIFLGIQHGYGLTQPKTRSALKHGAFFRDYADSVKAFRGWDDGGKFFTNYIAHPMQGSFTGFIQIQNDPKGMKQRFGKSKDYWNSRMKALAWSAAWSTQWEIGPISQSSIGNVGLYGKQGYVDLVITPTVGTALLVAEDALDRYFVESIERSTRNFWITIFSRMLLNPTRTMANLIRFKEPWYRDRPRR